MPLPRPRSGESKDEFIDRCMGNATMVDDFDDPAQRRAVCETQWDEGEKQSIGGIADMLTKKLVLGHVVKTHEEKRLSEEGEEIMTGIVEGYLATWDVDRIQDQFVRGAFLDSIAELQEKKRPLRLKRNHWNLIGGFDPDKLKEDDTGLYGVAEINLLVQEGREAYMLAKQGVLSDFSVGFAADTENVDIINNVRRFKKAKLWEASLVDEPMNPKANATMVRSYFHEHMRNPNEAAVAVAEYEKRFNEVDDDSREQIEAEINERYREVVGHESPLEKGMWGARELLALPKALRRDIIRTKKLSRDAVKMLVDAVDSGGESRESGTERDSGIGEIIKMLRGEKQTNEDTQEEVRGLLEAKASAVDAMRDIIGRDDFNEDAVAEFLGMVESDTERNQVITSLLGMDEDEDGETGMGEETEEEKAVDELTAILKGAW